MRALLEPDGPDPATAQGLHDRYRPPVPAWVRANFVSAADGATSLAGTSGGLGNDTDQAVFAMLRDHADVVLVGAGTVRAEGYGPIDPSAGRRSRRRADGRADVPRLAVVGRASSWRGDEPWIARATAPPLLLTTATAAADVSGCETVVCGEASVDLPAALEALTARGLTSVLCEGGPGLFGQLGATGLLDELCLTLAPVLAGPGPARVVAGAPWDGPLRGRLAGLLTDDVLLFCRYLLR